jgi:hypothetical protein
MVMHPPPTPCTLYPLPCMGINKLADVVACRLPQGVPLRRQIFLSSTPRRATSCKPHTHDDVFSASAVKSPSNAFNLVGRWLLLAETCSRRRERDVGGSMAAVRRWRQRKARRRRTARRQQRGGSSMEAAAVAAAVAAARQPDFVGSLAAAWQQWQRQRRWRQRDSTTSAVTAARQRDVGGSLAVARRRLQRQRQWWQCKARRWCTA